MNKINSQRGLSALFPRRAHAFADIRGSADNPTVKGTVKFYLTTLGVLVVAEITGLPIGQGSCDSKILGFHIHENGICTGNETDPFLNVGTHYNPNMCPHPYHAGDLPPLFDSKGYAFSAFLTDRFTINEIIGKAIIIHSAPDDFTTQPSGNSGTKIACGVIRGYNQ